MFLVPIVGVVAYFLFGRQRKADRGRTDDVMTMDCHNIPPIREALMIFEQQPWLKGECLEEDAQILFDSQTEVAQ